MISVYKVFWMNCRSIMARVTLFSLSKRTCSGLGMHSTAKIGFQNIGGDQYDRGRPSYPKQVTDHYLKDIIAKDLGHDAKIVDMAAGTGIFSEILLPAFPSTEIMAVEPTESFREIMNRKFADFPNISVHDGLADNLSFIESDSVNAIFCGQCFHWFSTLEALKEFERILVKQKGIRSHLMMIWNVANYEENAFLKQLRDDVVHLYHGDEGIKHSKFEPKRKWIEGMFTEEYLKSNGLKFKPTVYDCRPNAHRQSGGVDMVIDRVLSNSVFGTLSEGEREQISEQIKDIAHSHYGTLDVEFYIPYSTYVLHSCIETE